MESVEYGKKLKEFNSTPKYRRELEFLFQLISPKKNDRIIDYGCGIGTAVKVIRSRGFNTRGYDVRHYWDKKPAWLIDGFPHCDIVYFMHSLAHIEKPEALLKTIRSMLSPGGKVVVITPNRSWTEIYQKPDYVPDPTVIRHFTSTSLESLFDVTGYNILLQGQFGILKENINERLFIVAQK